MLFYGPSGAGKKTLVLALLREIYGPGVERIKVEAKQWKIDVGSRKVEVDLTLLSSNHHVEMNPSDVGMKDRYIVQEVIKEMARARPIGVDGAKGYKGKSRGPAASLPHRCSADLDAAARSAGAQRGGQAVQGGAARAATHYGKVFRCASSAAFAWRCCCAAPCGRCAER